ncbi:MAG: GNAT family N-acetyltransferase [Chroococcus sp. CMT-3BRIN-NPC107]|nr:GNAT family N-acetyltransferase [Chroococcus sp. CMT-3BRIN-NPC107]
MELEYRQAGIAKQTIKLIIAKFEEMGIKQIRLDTTYTNEGARKLFSSCGFRISIIEMPIELQQS